MNSIGQKSKALIVSICKKSLQDKNNIKMTKWIAIGLVLCITVGCTFARPYSAKGIPEYKLSKITAINKGGHSVDIYSVDSKKCGWFCKGFIVIPAKHRVWIRLSTSFSHTTISDYYRSRGHNVFTSNSSGYDPITGKTGIKTYVYGAAYKIFFSTEAGHDYIIYANSDLSGQVLVKDLQTGKIVASND